MRGTSGSTGILGVVATVLSCAAACSGMTSLGSGAVPDDASPGAAGASTDASIRDGSPHADGHVPTEASGDAPARAPIPFSQRLVRTGFGRTITPCNTDTDCQSAEMCFRLTDDVGFCDTAQPVEATSCQPQQSGWPPPHECGCNGLACGADQVCVAVDFMCSCAPMNSNTCVDTACSSPADCPNAVCRPSSFILGLGESGEAGRCIVPRCRSDGDCTLAPNGWCAVFIWDPSQQGESNLNAIDCLYPVVGGKCPPGTGLTTSGASTCKIQ
jgi:hypothetical protein